MVGKARAGTQKKRHRLLDAFSSNEVGLRSFLRRYLNSSHDVDDFCQETILRSLEAADRRTINEPKAFLYGIAKNLLRRHFESNNRNVVDFVAEYSPKTGDLLADNLEDQLSRQQRLECYAEIVAELPPQCQKVYVLKNVYGYSHKEISTKLGISVSTVEKHVALGLRRCRSAIDNVLRSEGLGRVGSTVSSAREILDTGSSNL